jgi:hypothetical protein
LHWNVKGTNPQAISMQQSERDGFWICNEVVYSYAGSDYKLLSYYLAVWQKAPQ